MISSITKTTDNNKYTITDNEYDIKYRELASVFNKGCDEKLNHEETVLVCDIYNVSSNHLFDSSSIELTTDTDWRTDYSIHFFKDGEHLATLPLKSYRTFNKIVNHVAIYMKEHYPKLKKYRAPKRTSFEDYVLDFGMYDGTKLVDMISDEQIRYCEWLYGSMARKNHYSCVKKSAFRWYVEKIIPIINGTNPP